MNRYKLTVEYCGTNYYGMQKQEKYLPTIQFAIEKALEKYCGEKEIFYCGRTDTGVHAIGQVIHFDMNEKRSIFSVVNGINFYLKDEEISVLSADFVSSNFHSRFDAKKRYYIYKIFERKSKLTFMSKTHYYCKHILNVEKMQNGANYLIGNHDFTSFRSSGCTASTPIKTIDSIKILKNEYINGNEIIIEIVAKSFLYNMIRNIVGCLLCIGAEKKDPSWAFDVLKATDRNVGYDTAPACGLYFYKVEY